MTKQEIEKDKKITVKGEVTSVKPKWDRHDEDAQGIVVVPANSDTAFWFRWSPERGQLNKHDKVELEGTVTGQGEPDRQGRVMVFLKGVKIKGKTCMHVVLTKAEKISFYDCDGCGISFHLVVDEGS